MNRVAEDQGGEPQGSPGAGSEVVGETHPEDPGLHPLTVLPDQVEAQAGSQGKPTALAEVDAVDEAEPPEEEGAAAFLVWIGGVPVVVYVLE